MFEATQDQEDNSVPSYMVAANNHNTGNLNSDWFSSGEPPVQRSLVNRAYNMVSSAALSGINSFYNTAVWAGNMFSDKDAEYRDTREWIASFDEDMGKYYADNRQAADLLGFVATSFVPGLGGIKVFNAGAKALTAAKEGVVGANMAKSLGILPGSRAALVKEAVDSYATTRTAFAMSNPQTVRALAAGFGEQALQAAAFETAVAVTMKKSPILSELDAGDMVTHVLTGAAFGGAVGGAVEGAVTVFGIKKGIKALDTKLAGVTQDARGVAGSKVSDEILLRRNDLDTLPANAPEGVVDETYQHLREQKIARLDNEDRKAFTALTNGNAELGNRLYEGLRTDPTSSYTAKLFNLEEIAVTADTNRLVKKYALGTDKATGEVRHFKLWGDNMGAVSDEAPAALHLADTLGSGQSVVVKGNKVIGNGESFVVKPGAAWNPLDASYNEALARNIWAMDDTVQRLASPKNGLLSISEHDIPMLTKAYREGFTDYAIVNSTGDVLAAQLRPDDLLKYIAKTKDSLTVHEMEASLAGVKGALANAEQIAYKYDVPMGFLTGEQVAAKAEDAIFGLAKAQKDYYNKFHANTPTPPPVESVKPWLHQQNYKMVYSTDRLAEVNGFELEALAVIKQRQILQQETNNIAVTAALGDNAALLPEFTAAQMQAVNRGGAGAGFLSFANGNYGTAASLAEHVGALVTKWVRGADAKVGEVFSQVNYNVVNNPTQAAELAAVLQKTRAAGSYKYVMNPEGTGLVLRDVLAYESAVAAGAADAVRPIIPRGVEETLPLSPNVAEWVKTHIAVNGERLDKLNNLRGAQGLDSNFDPATFYPPQPNPARFKFHAFVDDAGSVTSTGHTSMLYADSAVSLEKQIAEARAQGFNVFTPEDAAQYYKARGKYDYSLGLNESQIDSALQRSGSSAPAFPLTGSPQEMLQDLMQWHSKQEAIVIREAVSTKYSQQFGVLEQMGQEYAKVSNAKIGWFRKQDNPAKNPFDDYIKTFLGASLKNDYPLWSTVNNFVERAGTQVYQSVSKILGNAKSVYDLDEINQVFKKYGMQMAATPAQMEAWVNHPAGTAVVSRFIQQQNAILSALILRLDPVNALNNALGSTILTGAETKAVLRAMQAGNKESVGELASLLSLKVPGVEDTVANAGQLIANGYKTYFSQGSEALLKRYKELGYVTDTTTQFKQLMEFATIKGTETAAELESKAAAMFKLGKQIGDFGEKWTGNRLAEEMNRFVAANVMDQITSVAVKNGLMDQRTANTYINTFVNRTQGNMVASQRPQIFQGPVGQAIGLFQTYQFNIMQQLMRYVGEGSKKDAMTLLGLQGTVYGMNGLPAFQAINTHIIGTASGNTAHTDAYTSVNNIAGVEAGKWIMFGVSSNMFLDPDLKLNLYSRGDINPRHLSVVPTNVADVPIVGAWAKFAGAVKDGLSDVSNGADVWKSILQGIEQQGINRPLAGMARVARGIGEGEVSYSTSGKGNIVSANDFYSLANFARLTGAKPLDEALVQDAAFRVRTYEAKDAKRTDKLGHAIRVTVAGGGVPTQEDVEGFIETYTKAGGKQEEFNKWYMKQLRAANTSNANKLVEKVGSPASMYMQNIMGGRLLATPAHLAAQQEEQ